MPRESRFVLLPLAPGRYLAKKAWLRPPAAEVNAGGTEPASVTAGRRGRARVRMAAPIVHQAPPCSRFRLAYHRETIITSRGSFDVLRRVRTPPRNPPVPVSRVVVGHATVTHTEIVRPTVYGVTRVRAHLSPNPGPGPGGFVFIRVFAFIPGQGRPGIRRTPALVGTFSPRG